MTPKAWLYLGLLAAFLLAEAALGALAYDYGRKSGAKGAERAAKRELAQYKADAEQSRLKAAQANDALRKALARPIAQEVADAVKDNPSDCRLPGPVVERVRDAIREANAAE